MRSTLDNARAILSKNYNLPLIEAALLACFQEIRGAIMIAFPMGLPEYDPVQMNLDDDEDLKGTAVNSFLFGLNAEFKLFLKASKEVFELENTTLWWASKELITDKKLMDFIGKNEKTKIIIKMQRVGIIFCCSSTLIQCFRKDRVPL